MKTKPCRTCGNAVRVTLMNRGYEPLCRDCRARYNAEQVRVANEREHLSWKLHGEIDTELLDYLVPAIRKLLDAGVKAHSNTGIEALAEIQSVLPYTDRLIRWEHARARCDEVLVRRVRDFDAFGYGGPRDAP